MQDRYSPLLLSPPAFAAPRLWRKWDFQPSTRYQRSLRPGLVARSYSCPSSPRKALTFQPDFVVTISLSVGVSFTPRSLGFCTCLSMLLLSILLRLPPLSPLLPPPQRQVQQSPGLPGRRVVNLGASATDLGAFVLVYPIHPLHSRVCGLRQRM